MANHKKSTTSALYVWNGLCVFWGTSFHTLPHSHNTLQLVFDIDNEFLLKDENCNWSSFSTAIIDANHIHQLDSNGGIQLFMYLDSQSRYAKLIKDRYLPNGGIKKLDECNNDIINHDFLKQLLVNDDSRDLYNGCQQILQSLIDISEFVMLDSRVHKALEYINSTPLKSFKVKDIAICIGLSESRLRHLFKEHVGQSLQSYILWRRVMNALNDVLKGEKLLDTAYEYGFSDPSHMTKSFIEVMGVPPSKIRAYVNDTKVIICHSNIENSFNTQVFDGWSNLKELKNIKI